MLKTITNLFFDLETVPVRQISPDSIHWDRVDSAYDAFKEVIDADVDEMDHRRIQEGYSRLSTDEQMAVFSKFGKEKPEDSKRGYKAIIKELLAIKGEE